jgi:hypothetical protein
MAVRDLAIQRGIFLFFPLAKTTHSARIVNESHGCCISYIVLAKHKDKQEEPMRSTEECSHCHQDLTPHLLERPFNRIELAVYRSAFVIILVVELSKFIKHLLIGW